MGCKSSKPVGDEANGGDNSNRTAKEDYVITVNEKCPHIRLDHMDGLKSMHIQGKNYSYDLRYCYVSQRGYYPNALGKANQDSYVVCESILKDKNCHMFGVFDGHGEMGDYCSHFAAEGFANYITKELKANGGCDSIENKTDAVYKSAFVKTNKALHKSEVDDTLSGTTGVTIVLRGDTLFVGNVGDSRAIVATEVNGKPKFSALSSDQTPFRKDERDRLRLKGAQIMTLDQIEGNEPLHDNWGAEAGEEIDEVGDPPRVWDSTLERPGCAFTRSIGDAIAEKVGVYAEPEVLTWKLTPLDKFAIVASDGVFEFLTSQAVVDMMLKFKDPLEAAKHIVAESYRLWLTYDDRTDDITIIVIMFDNFKTNSDVDEAAMAAELKQREIDISLADAEVAKPVRTGMTKAKRKVISENWTEEDNIEFDFAANATTKSPEDLERITKMVSSNFMFQNLTPVQLGQILQVMKLRNCSAGEMIIKEGDTGNELYVIDSGEFSVHKKDDSGVSQLVFTYTTSGAVFGELSLMYGKPRAASIYAATDGRLWSVSRQAFRSSLMKKQQQGLLKSLRAIPIISSLRMTQLQRLCSGCTEETMKDGDIVFKMGTEVPWSLCVILSGTIGTSGATVGKKEKSRGEGSYIASPELGTVVHGAHITSTRAKLAFISAELFNEVIGEKAQKLLKEHCTKTNRGATLARKASIVGATTNTDKVSPNDLRFESAVVALGDFGYVGNFKVSMMQGIVRSAKLVGKQKLAEIRMDTGYNNERVFLSAIGGLCNFIPKLITSCQNDKIAMLLYGDQFVGDLTLAMSSGQIPEVNCVYYAACIYKAVEYMHEFGLMHRFVNPSSVYITTQGVVKLSDLRYAKKMDGSKSFTVCGDPLFFAPELISQQGYDYAADLWAFGCLVYEMFEGTSPFGTENTDETAIFKAIANHKELTFTERSPPSARTLMNALVNVQFKERLGYHSASEVKHSACFSHFDWINDFDSSDSKGCTPPPLNFQPSVLDPGTLLVEQEQETFTSSTFEDF